MIRVERRASAANSPALLWQLIASILTPNLAHHRRWLQMSDGWTLVEDLQHGRVCSSDAAER
jgi:hypothetical protein